MAISVACPACGRQYSVKDDAAGKRFKCKDCEAVIDVPLAAGDDFGADDYGDPYGGDLGAPPAASLPSRRRSSAGRSASAAAAAERTKLPAIFMYVVCTMSIGYSIINLITQAMGLQAPMPEFGNQQNQMAVQIGQGIGVAMVVLFIVRDAFLIYAFSRMHVVRSYGIAFAGAVISVIPCIGSPCCALGVPFGIWALVVLNDPSVKSAFR